mmetsp:Transcript_55132/g.112785  ORF Transcript_55132/g.112785 Transcript_55132/m.112785 type:complete len:207 (+) Transcript_55132:55-675(+)
MNGHAHKMMIVLCHLAVKSRAAYRCHGCTAKTHRLWVARSGSPHRLPCAEIRRAATGISLRCLRCEECAPPLSYSHPGFDSRSANLSQHLKTPCRSTSRRICCAAPKLPVLASASAIAEHGQLSVMAEVACWQQQEQRPQPSSLQEHLLQPSSLLQALSKRLAQPVPQPSAQSPTFLELEGLRRQLACPPLAWGWERFLLRAHRPL